MDYERSLTKISETISLIRNLNVLFSIMNIGMISILIFIKPELIQEEILIGILCVLTVVICGSIFVLILVRKSPDLTLLFSSVILFVSGCITGIIIPFILRLNHNH